MGRVGRFSFVVRGLKYGEVVIRLKLCVWRGIEFRLEVRVLILNLGFVKIFVVFFCLV